MTKQELKERYLQLYCELGIDHPDTKAAKKMYDTWCIAESVTADKAWAWISECTNTYDSLKDSFYQTMGGIVK